MSYQDVMWARLIDRLTHLERVVQRQSMRLNNMVREAKVLEVDPATGTAIVDAHGIPTKPVPWLQHAGSIVDWEPPAVGQRMVLFSPNGDMGRGFLLPGGFTDSVPQPYSEGAMFGRTIGSTKIFGSDGSYNVETGNFHIKADVLVEGNFIVKGSVFQHNDKNVGDTHGHETAPPGPPGPPI